MFTGGPYGGQWGHPAAYAGGGGADYVYYSGSGEGGGDYLRVLYFNGHFPQLPSLQDVANTPRKFGYDLRFAGRHLQGRLNPGSAIVWEVYATEPTGRTAARGV